MRLPSPRSSKASQPSRSSNYPWKRGVPGSCWNHLGTPPACTLRQNAVFSLLENRLCLGVLVGRQRFRTLKIFGTHGNLPAYPACAGYGAGHPASLAADLPGDTEPSSKTLKRDKLQRVAGITFRIETVHKSLFALMGEAVPVSEFSRLPAFPHLSADFCLHLQETPALSRPRTL
jgi:hypothetical protein